MEQAVTVYVGSDRDWELCEVMTLRDYGKPRLIFLIKEGLKTFNNNLHLERGLLELVVLEHPLSSASFNTWSFTFLVFILFLDQFANFGGKKVA